MGSKTVRFVISISQLWDFILNKNSKCHWKTNKKFDGERENLEMIWNPKKMRVNSRERKWKQRIISFVQERTKDGGQLAAAAAAATSNLISFGIWKIFQLHTRSDTIQSFLSLESHISPLVLYPFRKTHYFKLRSFAGGYLKSWNW